LNRFIFKVQNAKKNFGGAWKRIPGGYSTVSTKTGTSIKTFLLKFDQYSYALTPSNFHMSAHRPWTSNFLEMKHVNSCGLANVALGFWSAMGASPARRKTKQKAEAMLAAL